ncbi:MAG: sulfotransferase [Desulfatibacillum sp.]|nr:sulfotransferase [Desulfatibacillum sp.]
MKNRAIAILGMHRSGTSLAARGINLLGAWMGEESALMGPARDNPAGFWERWDLMEFHDKILHAMGRTWHDTAALPIWDALPQAATYQIQLEQMLDFIFKHQSLWAFKDPRACLLLPLWSRAVARQNTLLNAVLMVRNPLDVAQSLKHRNGFSLQKSFTLWELHYSQVLGDISPTPLTVVDFDDLVCDPEIQFRRIAKTMGISADDTAIKAAASSVQPRLISHHSSMGDLLQADPPQSLLKLYRTLGDASGH